MRVESHIPPPHAFGLPRSSSEGSSLGRFSSPENSSASSFCWGSLNSASILRRLTPHTRLTSNFNLDP
ncbi:hypothetical protein BpHYR1_004118 [Brachionus plicatilis]|uniref:Uncharacterized protein n=1 Tax=Brachionus plicatilis TaxID=10195 RepID=A0A3M7R0N3_BRAPC|nr:hypothetical protein BpHYR1_004118 [Brachionus plicatilis]